MINVNFRYVDESVAGTNVYVNPDIVMNLLRRNVNNINGDESVADKYLFQIYS